MSDSNQKVSSAEKWYRYGSLADFLIAAVPMVAAVVYLIPGKIDNPLRERVVGSVGWLVVELAVLAALYAVRRVRVNVYFNRRPFTEKDHKYCHRAARVVFGASVFVFGFSFFSTKSHHHTAIGLLDVITAQFVCLTVLASVLKLLTLVHYRGARYYAELEKGV